MLTCEICGEIVPEGTKYCPNCGTPLSGGTSPVPDTPDSFVPDTADVPEDSGMPDSTADSAESTAAPMPETAGTTENTNPYSMPSSGSIPQQASNQTGSTYPPTGSGQSYGQTPPQTPYYGQTGYGQQGNPQTNYGQPNSYYPPQYHPPKKNDGKAIAGLILGIVSIVSSCTGSGVLFGILGIVFSCMSRKEAKNNPNGTASSSGLSTGGLICSIIGIVISVIVILIAAVGIVSDMMNGGSTFDSSYDSYEYYGDFEDACRYFFGLW